MPVWYDEEELRGGFVGNAFWFSWEPGVITFLQSWVTPLLQKFFEAVTFFGDEYAIILVIGFLYWGYKKDLGKRIGKEKEGARSINGQVLGSYWCTA